MSSKNMGRRKNGHEILSSQNATPNRVYVG
jgi:hypothetical protein